MTEQDKLLLENFKARLQLLFDQNSKFRERLKELKEKVEMLEGENLALSTANARLSAEYENLKIARVLSLTDNDKQKAKQKINKIVREIDRCIAQLNV